jgi:hypothetical protein
MAGDSIARKASGRWTLAVVTVAGRRIGDPEGVVAARSSLDPIVVEVAVIREVLRGAQSEHAAP